ncbi:hypothetical protein CPC08DRAFT_557279 [Agrocybe pediades]|nr:hypothetical protein CPC08DRAFT_557279 [Agrocybe pediades]
MIPVLVATLSLVAIIVTVIIMIRRRRRKGNRVDGASQVMPYNLRARKDYVPAAEASLKQEFKEAREVAPTMPDHGKGQAERIPIGLVGETGIRDQMVVSGRDGEQLEQNAASGSFTPSATMAIRLDELERQMRSLRTADVAQNQIGGTNLASAEMVATIQRLLVEMNRPPPEYSSALHER